MTSTLGKSPSDAIATKSLTGSYDRLAIVAGAIVYPDEAASTVYPSGAA